MFDGKVPVFDTVWEARQKTGCNVSVIFVPAAGAADGILEAVDAGVELVICITEGIPVMDMMRVKAQMAGNEVAPHRTELSRESSRPAPARSESCQATFTSREAWVSSLAPERSPTKRSGN